MKLEDIKKKNIYSVPDKYFDQLPARIQSRVNEKKPVFGLSLNWSLAFKVAAPALALVLILFYFDISTTDNSTLSSDELLAQVSTDDLIAYLETTDITADEIIEELDLSNIELDFYEEGPIMQDMDMNDEDIDALLDEYGIDGDLL
ncbi:MAG: hypothetical protein KAK04_14630 [Cyclobacteriaceae bacterium]|nr:hypothetical protein [Cyclobacteriaceae bacterium]